MSCTSRPCHRPLRWVVVLVLAVSAAACDDSGGGGVSLDDGFPSGVGSMGDGAAESSFRSAMESYGMQPGDVDCMVTEAFAGLPAEEPSTGFNWTAEELDEFAASCDIDVAELSYSYD